MSASIPEALAALALGEGRRVHGVRVVRCSLFGFRVEDGAEVLDPSAAAARIAAQRPRTVATEAPPRARPAPAKAAPVRVEICFRCAGDGLGRRDRGTCGVCHGRGIQAAEPPEGWADAPPARIAAAVSQATAALGSAHHPRARETLGALLATLRAASGPREIFRRTEPPPGSSGASAA